MACTTFIGRKKFIAKLSDEQAPCAFCNNLVNDETKYGKLYSIGPIHCHYFCVLLSSCLIQKGRDEEGLYGFLYPDIITEIERSKKHKCTYCYKGGATLGCSVAQCRKQFHLPCGKERNSVSLFYGNYKTYCRDHAPKQKIPNSIMNKAIPRRRKAKKMKQDTIDSDFKEDSDETETVCVICYEKVDGFPTTHTFWPPCCAGDTWFHRSCIDRMALSAGVHYLKCPLCNDKEHFYKAVLEQGYYVPDRDAAWELEQNAYSEIYERPSVCCANECKCPDGREFYEESGPWDIQLCVLCGSSGSHLGCSKSHIYLCENCSQISHDRERLEELAKVSLPTQNQSSSTKITGPIMPSRMSLRRTKGRRSNLLSASTSTRNLSENNENSTTQQSRQELNLKSSKKRLLENNEENINNYYSSLVKLIENEMIETYNIKFIKNFDMVLNEVLEKLKKPRPLVEKRRVVKSVLQDFLMNNISKENCKTKEDIKEWNSPKKMSIEETEKPEILEPLVEIKSEIESGEIINKIEQKTPIKNEKLDEEGLIIQDTPKLKKVNIQNDSMEILKKKEIINVDLIEIKNLNSISEKDTQKCLKFNPFGEVLEKNTDIDVESFKNQYLIEVDRKLSSNIDSKIDNNKKLDDCNKHITKKAPKRKLRSQNSIVSKRRKTTKMVENNKFENKTELSVRNRNINLKIKWKNDEINLKISNAKRNKRRKKKVLKQYILSPQFDSSDVIIRPTSDVTLAKPKKIKMEKSSDNLKQTSISSFFKPKLN